MIFVDMILVSMIPVNMILVNMTLVNLSLGIPTLGGAASHNDTSAGSFEFCHRLTLNLPFGNKPFPLENILLLIISFQWRLKKEARNILIVIAWMLGKRNTITMGDYYFQYVCQFPPFTPTKAQLKLLFFRDLVKLGGNDFFNMCHGVKFSFVFLF